MTAAASGHAELAVSNAFGGIAAQTFFLAVADMFYRKANLEHAAASAENLMMGAFLITLLSINLVAFAAPEFVIWHIHPASLVLVLAYMFGVRLLLKTHRMPMWLPRRTSETTREKEPKRHRKFKKFGPLWISFLVYSLVVCLSGWVLSKTGIVIASDTGLSESLVGGVFTAVSTSLPELVIAVTAVRLGSLTLAVGDIIGGNAFDTLFIASSDAFYHQGSIYAAVSANEQFWLAITILMTGVLLMGLVHRERHGIANIGWESFAVVVLYIGGLLFMTL